MIGDNDAMLADEKKLYRIFSDNGMDPLFWYAVDSAGNLKGADFLAGASFNLADATYVTEFDGGACTDDPLVTCTFVVWNIDTGDWYSQALAEEQGWAAHDGDIKFTWGRDNCEVWEAGCDAHPPKDEFKP